jgi:hypothetical protein
MTTKVTVEASGPTYPARVVKTGGGEVRDELVASGEKLEVWCGVEDTITVTEEYHAAGYPAKPASDAPQADPPAAAE